MRFFFLKMCFDFRKKHQKKNAEGRWRTRHGETVYVAPSSDGESWFHPYINGNGSGDIPQEYGQTYGTWYLHFRILEFPLIFWFKLGYKEHVCENHTINQENHGFVYTKISTEYTDQMIFQPSGRWFNDSMIIFVMKGVPWQWWYPSCTILHAW